MATSSFKNQKQFNHHWRISNLKEKIKKMHIKKMVGIQRHLKHGYENVSKSNTEIVHKPIQD